MRHYNFCEAAVIVNRYFCSLWLNTPFPFGEFSVTLLFALLWASFALPGALMDSIARRHHLYCGILTGPSYIPCSPTILWNLPNRKSAFFFSIKPAQSHVYLNAKCAARSWCRHATSRRVSLPAYVLKLQQRPFALGARLRAWPTHEV